MRAFARYRARARWLIARTPAAFWVLTVLLALLSVRIAALVGGRSPPLGRRVVVTTRSVGAGRRLARRDVRLVRAAPGLLPPDPVERLETAVGRVAVVDLQAFQVVRVRKLAAVGTSATGALIPHGWRAIGVPADDATPVVRVGSWVDVVAVFEGRSGLVSKVVVSGSRVVELAQRRVTIAVPFAAVTHVAEALVGGHVLLAVAEPHQPP